VLNRDYQSGQESSLRTGAQALPPGAAGAVVLLADMLLVTAEMLRAAAERLSRGPETLVISSFGGVVAPPTAYGALLFDELRALDGGGCGKLVIKRHRAEAATLEWPQQALADTDLPEEFSKIRSLLEGPPARALDAGGAR
jgi:CTP:molybdopterin cytidylyltransferase MocA